MKFFAYIMLIGVASSIKLTEAPVSNQLLQKDVHHHTKGEFINLLAHLSGRLQDSKEGFLSEEDVVSIFAPEQAQIARDLFNKADKNEDGKMDRKELLGNLFSIVSEDADGTMGGDEFKTMVSSYANFLDVNLKKDWKRIVDRWFQHISNGDGQMSIQDLYQFLEKSGESVSTLKGAIQRDLAKH